MIPARLRTSRLAASAAALAAALAAAGCGGISDPYNEPQGTTAATTATAATQPQTVTIQRPGMGPMGPDDPPPRPLRIDEDALSADAGETIRTYAELTGTWTWEDVAANYRRASQLAIDGARADAAQAAAQIPLDPRYRTRETRQTTVLEGIVAKPSEDPDEARYVVVQRRRIEMKATQASNAWLVSIVVLRRVGDRWAVASWEDQA